MDERSGFKWYYTDEDLRDARNVGFWQGAGLATFGWIVITIVSLYYIGAYG